MYHMVENKKSSALILIALKLPIDMDIPKLILTVIRRRILVEAIGGNV